MRARIFLTSACALALLVTCAVGTAAATPLDKRTTFTFNAPVAVPGVVLPAGSYVFRLADDTRGRDVVQVIAAEGGAAYAMFFTLRTPRGEPVDKPEIRFMETASDMPAAVKAWWYPAETQGYEFVYPREQARLLAAGTGRPVLTEVTPAAEPQPQYVWEVPEEPAPVIAREEPVLVGEVAQAVQPAVEEPAPVTLPKTDSPTATLVLAGLLSLMAALMLRGILSVRT